MSTPYPEPGGEGMSSGWSGSDTSHERALREDADGVTSRRQQRVMQLLNQTSWLGNKAVGRNEGLTVKDLREITRWHHGQASSALSVLHKEGKIARLKARRDRCAIYVLPEQVNGREVAPHGREKGPVGLSQRERGALARLKSAGPLLPSDRTALAGLIERLM
jgi:DNA-binding MarR family transcriptional regulator